MAFGDLDVRSMGFSPCDYWQELSKNVAIVALEYFEEKSPHPWLLSPQGLGEGEFAKIAALNCVLAASELVGRWI
jgi:hypothetical protein